MWENGVVQQSVLITLKRGRRKLEIRQKYYFASYTLDSQLVWLLYFGSNQFDHCYFQLIVNLVFIVNY